jgi:predicted RNase H-like HicB family nuclease
MPFAHAILHEENGVFGVSFPDFPGCITGADSEEDAIRKADEVLTFHVAGMLEDGEALPARRSVKALRADPETRDSLADGVLFLARYELPRKSVRINISMDETLVEAIDRAAEYANQSRSGFLAEAARLRIRDLLNAD